MTCKTSSELDLHLIRTLHKKFREKFRCIFDRLNCTYNNEINWIFPKYSYSMREYMLLNNQSGLLGQWLDPVRKYRIRQVKNHQIRISPLIYTPGLYKYNLRVSSVDQFHFVHSNLQPYSFCTLIYVFFLIKM